MHKLDIIIPVYNEARNITAAIEGLRSSVKTPFRILICYDHDEDDTLGVLRAYRDAPGELLLVKNLGSGVHSAVVTGFRMSTAPAVLVLPADDTFNAGIIDTMVGKFDEGCEIVVASRFLPGGCMVGCPWVKALLVRASSFTLHHLARLPAHDATNGFRLFSRRVLDQIEIESSQGLSFSIELLVKCHRLGWMIDEVPARLFERSQGTSRFRLIPWLPAYLRWYFYAFATTYLRRSARTVLKQEPSARDQTATLRAGQL
jgi:dolichol-phosphate mannosyltransferase